MQKLINRAHHVVRLVVRKVNRLWFQASRDFERMPDAALYLALFSGVLESRVSIYLFDQNLHPLDQLIGYVRIMPMGANFEVALIGVCMFCLIAISTIFFVVTQLALNEITRRFQVNCDPI